MAPLLSFFLLLPSLLPPLSNPLLSPMGRICQPGSLLSLSLGSLPLRHSGSSKGICQNCIDPSTPHGCCFKTRQGNRNSWMPHPGIFVSGSVGASNMGVFSLTSLFLFNLNIYYHLLSARLLSKQEKYNYLNLIMTEIRPL